MKLVLEFGLTGLGPSVEIWPSRATCLAWYHWYPRIPPIDIAIEASVAGMTP